MLKLNTIMITTSQEIIAKLIRDYNIAESGWIADANAWIKEALQYIGTNRNKILIKKDFTVKGTGIKIPCDLEDIVAIVYDGMYLRFQNFRNIERFTDTRELRPSVNGQRIMFNTDNEVKGTLYYYAFMEDCDGDFFITDHVKVTEAICTWILSKLMLRGYKHPVLAYSDVYAQWRQNRAEASNYLIMPAPYEVANDLAEFLNPRDIDENRWIK